MAVAKQPGSCWDSGLHAARSWGRTAVANKGVSGAKRLLTTTHHPGQLPSWSLNPLHATAISDHNQRHPPGHLVNACNKKEWRNEGEGKCGAHLATSSMPRMSSPIKMAGSRTAKVSVVAPLVKVRVSSSSCSRAGARQGAQARLRQWLSNGDIRQAHIDPAAACDMPLQWCIEFKCNSRGPTHLDVCKAGAEHGHSHRARLVAQPPNVACRFECCSPLLLHGQHLERANRGHTQQGLCTSGGPATSSAASMACWRHCEQHRRGAASLAGAWRPQTRWAAEPYNGVWDMRFCFRQQVLHLEGCQLARLVRGGAHRQLLVSQQGSRRGVQLGGVVHGLLGNAGKLSHRYLQLSILLAARALHPLRMVSRLRMVSPLCMLSPAVPAAPASHLLDGVQPHHAPPHKLVLRQGQPSSAGEAQRKA